MLSRLTCAVAIAVLIVSSVSAQTIRFDTNVGYFDMLLNPTANIHLQGHVDNILAYVEDGRYDLTVINRAADGNNADPTDDFVLQMGGFQASFLNAPNTFSSFPPVDLFDPVVVDTDGDNGIDFDTTGLTNSRGTVTLALSSQQTTTFDADPGSPTVNSGTSSFFVNLGDNSKLDPEVVTMIDHPSDTDMAGMPVQVPIVTGGFVPFAQIENMATVDLILSLNQANLSDGGLAGSDLPLLGNNRLVIVERAFVIDPTPAMATMAAMATSGTSSEDTELPLLTQPVIEDPNPQLQSPGTDVPEPPTLIIVVGAFMLLAVLKRGEIG